MIRLGFADDYLSPQEKKLIERRPTESTDAYDLYLKARQLRDRDESVSGETATSILILAQAAVELDPNFAEAWGLLASFHAYAYWREVDHTPARLDQAKAAVDQVLRLAPDSAAALQSSGDYYYYGYRDYGRAVEQYEKGLRLRPNDPDLTQQLGLVSQRMGNWKEALVNFRKVVKRDPANSFISRRLVYLLQNGRRYDEALAEFRRMAVVFPTDLWIAIGPGWIAFEATGSTKEGDAILAQLTPAEAGSGLGLRIRRQWAFWTGKLNEYLRLDRIQPNDQPQGRKATHVSALNSAQVMAALGDPAGARKQLADIEDWRKETITDPGVFGPWMDLGKAEAILGNNDEALRCARKAVELLPESLDPLIGPERRTNLACVLAWTGDKKGAVAEYARLLSIPWSYQNIHRMRLSPEYFPLRGDPEFEALLNDSKNNAPLF